MKRFVESERSERDIRTRLVAAIERTQDFVSRKILNRHAAGNGGHSLRFLSPAPMRGVLRRSTNGPYWFSCLLSVASRSKSSRRLAVAMRLDADVPVAVLLMRYGFLARLLS
jgi:hypothetical protein